MLPTEKRRANIVASLLKEGGMDNEKLGEKKELRKSNPEIGFRITGGRMTFLPRKIYNSFVYRAQLAGIMGKGVLPYDVAWDLAEHGVQAGRYFWMSMADLIDDVAAEMGAGGRVRKYLQELMTVTVERNEVGWEIQHVLQSVRIINTASPNINQRGGKLMIGWEFPGDLEEMILSPKTRYTRMSLYFQGRLKTEAALVLYEICKRWSTMDSDQQSSSMNKIVVTPKMPWEEWYMRLTGNTSSGVAYKDFKKRSLATAIKEVNALKDIEVTLVEIKAQGSKAVEQLRFNVETLDQGNLELTDHPIIDSQMLRAIEALGVSPAISEKALTEYGEEKVRAALQFTADRQSNKKLPELTSPAAYFKKALADDLPAATLKAQQEKLAARANQAKQADENYKKQVAASVAKTAKEIEDGVDESIKKLRVALMAYEDLQAEEKDALREEYCDTLAPVLAKQARRVFQLDGWSGNKDGKLFLKWLNARLGLFCE